MLIPHLQLMIMLHYQIPRPEIRHSPRVPFEFHLYGALECGAYFELDEALAGDFGW